MKWWSTVGKRRTLSLFSIYQQTKQCIANCGYQLDRYCTNGNTLMRVFWRGIVIVRCCCGFLNKKLELYSQNPHCIKWSELNEFLEIFYSDSYFIITVINHRHFFVISLTFVKDHSPFNKQIKGGISQFFNKRGNYD